MAYNERQDSDQGWSKPRLKAKKNQRSADGAAAPAGAEGPKKAASSGGGLRARIRARREQERVKGVSQGIKARSKAFNQKEEEKAVQAEVGTEAIGKKRPSNKKKFKSNKLFGLTLLAPGLDESDPEGVAALDDTLAACLGQAPPNAQPALAIPSANSSPASAEGVEPWPVNSSSAPRRPVSPLRPYPGPASQTAGQPQPYIPGRRSVASSPTLALAAASAPPEGPAPQAAPSAPIAQAEPIRSAAQLSPAAPTSPLRPYRGQPGEAVTQRQPYIPGRPSSPAAGRPAASGPAMGSPSVGGPPRGVSPAAPNFGASTASVYSAPVSAAHLGASPSKNTVLPLPVGRGHKGAPPKNEVLHEGGSHYRSSARAHSNDDFKSSNRELAARPNDRAGQEAGLAPNEEEETTTEGKSLIELLESVPVANKRKGPSRYA